MSADAPIHNWSASYYVNGEKRWVSGTLLLTRSDLRFVSEQSRQELARFPLDSVVEIKMEASSFIFSALTVLERGNVKHWFGSLRPARAAVFHVLEHFWRERLLSVGAGGSEVRQPQAGLSKGQELLSLVCGAQRRLANTGKVLNQQGEQFDNMIQGLDKIESDLDVADKLLCELESPPWWPFGRLPWRSQQQQQHQQEVKTESAAAKAPAQQKSPGRSQQKPISSVPAVVWRGRDAASEARPGSLTLLPSALELRDAGGQLLHRFESREVDEVLVHSPYEISVRQRFIGRPDVCFRLLSARMSEALAVLEVQYKKKVEFTADYAAFQATPTHDHFATTPGSEGGGWGAAASAQGPECEVPVEIPAGELTQLQLRVQQPTVTEQEAQELKRMLLQLKSLALEAETELDRQDEALDVLTSCSDRATMSIGKHNRRMRKLL